MMLSSMKTAKDRFIRSRIYLPDTVVAKSGLYGSIPFRQITVKTKDNIELAGLRSDPKGDARYTILFFHGSGGCAATRAHLVAPLCQNGADVVVADYRGYGINLGIPTEQGLLTDSQAFLDYAKSSRNGPLIILGHSLGGALSILLTARDATGLEGLITLGTFTSLADCAPWFSRFMLPDKFDALGVANQISLPWRMLHEKDDNVVPFTLAQRLFAAIENPVNTKFEAFSGGGHTLDASKLVKHIEALVST